MVQRPRKTSKSIIWNSAKAPSAITTPSEPGVACTEPKRTTELSRDVAETTTHAREEKGGRHEYLAQLAARLGPSTSPESDDEERVPNDSELKAEIFRLLEFSKTPISDYRFLADSSSRARIRLRDDASSRIVARRIAELSGDNPVPRRIQKLLRARLRENGVDEELIRTLKFFDARYMARALNGKDQYLFDYTVYGHRFAAAANVDASTSGGFELTEGRPWEFEILTDPLLRSLDHIVGNQVSDLVGGLLPAARQLPSFSEDGANRAYVSTSEQLMELAARLRTVLETKDASGLEPLLTLRLDDGVEHGSVVEVANLMRAIRALPPHERPLVHFDLAPEATGPLPALLREAGATPHISASVNARRQFMLDGGSVELSKLGGFGGLFTGDQAKLRETLYGWSVHVRELTGMSDTLARRDVLLFPARSSLSTFELLEEIASLSNIEPAARVRLQPLMHKVRNLSSPESSEVAVGQVLQCLRDAGSDDASRVLHVGVVDTRHEGRTFAAIKEVVEEAARRLKSNVVIELCEVHSEPPGAEFWSTRLASPTAGCHEIVIAEPDRDREPLMWIGLELTRVLGRAIAKTAMADARITKELRRIVYRGPGSPL